VGKLTAPSIPASILLADIDPRDAQCLLCGFLAALAFPRIGKVSRDEDELVVRPNRRVGVSNQLDIGKTAQWPARLVYRSICGSCFERRVGLARQPLLGHQGAGPEVEIDHLGLALPRTWDVGDVPLRHVANHAESTLQRRSFERWRSLEGLGEHGGEVLGPSKTRLGPCPR
jgi:hypothetical protein